MTTYNTGNPVPSADARDRYDNTQTLDEVVNGTEESYLNRTGKHVLSLQGMQNRFNQALLSIGYENPVPYAAGIVLTRYTQVIEKDGEFYRPAPGSLPFTTTGNWATDSVKFVFTGDATLRADLADNGGDLVFVEANLTGAVKRSLNMLGEDFISVRAFGAIGDDTSHPLSEFFPDLASAQLHYSNAPVTSLAQQVDWAAWWSGAHSCAAAGRMLYGGGGGYVMSDCLEIPEGLRTDADGAGEWLAWTPVFPKNRAPCQMRFIGTGERKFRLPLVSDNRTAGGVVVNQSPRDSFDGSYKLTSFKNEDGTDKLFSCAVKTARSGRGIQMANMRIVLDNNGIAGYNDTVSTDLGADWDVGLWNESAQNFIAMNVHVVGHWRMYGSLQTAVINNDDSESGNGLTGSEYSRYLFCNFQGAVGVGVRGGDTYKIVGVGANYIDIEDAPNLPFHGASSGRVRAGGSETSAGIFNYSAVTTVGANLRLTVVESTAGVAVGGVLVANVYGFGISNTVYQDCEISPFCHPTGRRATQVGLTKPSAGIEASGSFIRGLIFRGSKVIGHDDVALHLHNVADFSFESQAIIESKVDSVTGTVGMRCIASPAPANNTRVANPMGQTDRVRIEYGSSITNTAPDFRPYSGLAAPGRFNGVGDTGLFQPQSIRWMDKQHPMDRQNSILAAPGGGSAIVRDSAGTSRIQVSTDVSIRDSSGAAVLTSNGAGSQLTVTAGGIGQVFLSSGLRPVVDGVPVLGANAFRYKDIYLVNAPTVTSDENQKADIRSIEDKAMDAWELVEYAQFRNIQAVEEKGDGARLHFGVIAQHVRDCFEAAGVDPFAWGILCYQEWGYTPATYTLPDDGSEEWILVAPAREAGSVLMVRYEEALCLAAATARRSQKRMEASLSGLIARIEALEAM